MPIPHPIHPFITDAHFRKWAWADEPTWLRRYDVPFGLWTKQGIVLDVGASGKFDDVSVSSPCVIYDPDKKIFKMWYQGYSGTRWSIGYATSSDGMTWTRQNNGDAVLDVGGTDAWDAAHVMNPSVLKLGASSYRMYYTGVNFAAVYAIGTATSSDGITWTKYAGNPILTTGAAGAWDNAYVFAPSALFFPNRVLMLYSAEDPTGVGRLGIAYSNDGFAFTKFAGNPILSPTAGTWDSDDIEYAAIFWLLGTWYVFYAGRNPTSSPYFSIGMAHSYTCQEHWVKDMQNPIIPGTSGWERGCLYPCLVRKDRKYFMWYAGDEYTTRNNKIGLATMEITYG